MKNKDYWIAWAKAAGLRALRTFAQSLCGAIGASVFLDQVRWVEALSAAALSAVLSVLMSIGGLPEVEPEEVTEDDSNR